MELLPVMCVATGGAIGSLLRYFISLWIGKLNTSEFPLPIFLVNISGSFLMGLWIGTMAVLLPEKTKELHLLIAVGILGGYTTFSTFSLESYMLIEKGSYALAAAYIGGSVVLSVAALFLGLMLVRAVGA